MNGWKSLIVMQPRAMQLRSCLVSCHGGKEDSNAHLLLPGLGFDKEMMNRPTKEFSGGWR